MVTISKAAGYVIRPLEARDNRAAFCCGNTNVDRFFHDSAVKCAESGLSLVWVAAHSKFNTIAGFYTLTSSQVGFGEIPEAIVKKHGLRNKTTIPVTLLGQFGVHNDFQNSGNGKLLCMSALNKSLQASKLVASLGVFLKARTDLARAFWAKREFTSLGVRDDGLEHFFMSMEHIEKLAQ